MKETNDDFPAFPTYGLNHGSVIFSGGMTMRDYFAAHAMQGLTIAAERDPMTRDIIAECSYGIADAMLKAREK